MKKLLLSLAALAMIAVGCEKNENILSTSEKSVGLTILNGGGSGTKAVTTPSGDQNFECAVAADLTVLFADKAGKVVETRALTAGTATPGTTAGEDGLTPTTYTFHKLPETVQQVAVIALRGNSAPENLAAAEALWKTETKDAEVANIVVYGASGQMTQNGTCQFDGVNYPFFEGKVRVAPAHTRLEVTSIKCTDLGENEYGYSKITLDKMTFGEGEEYVQTLGNVLASKDDVATAGDNQVWSWNWLAPKAVANLVVDLTVEGKNYTVAIPKKTLTINGYNK
ncbi:MAG: hypothetical protein IIW25_06765, partial [Bacteroidales bacterium]|nr:hypothetical protein [Bacteroidales bacterium]